MEWLQKIYILFLNPFCDMSSIINSSVKKRFIGITCFALFCTCYVWYSIVGIGRPLSLFMRMVVAIALIVILVFLGLEKPLKTIRWNEYVFYSWFLLGMTIFVMGFFTNQNAGYWLSGPVMAIGLPCFYMIYSDEDKQTALFDYISKAAIICSLIYYVICLAGEFFNNNTWFDGRYNGLTSDANIIGELCLAAFCCITYFLLVYPYTDRWKKAGIISMGCIIGQIYWTQSRTTILAILFICIFCGVIIIKNYAIEKNAKNLFKTIIPFVLAIIVGFASIGVIDEVRNIHLGNPSLIDMAEASSGVSLDESEEKDDYRNLLPIEGTDLNSYSSGRLHIWEVYAREFNFIGNDADAKVPISPEIQQRTAHNSFIEITYRSGYFAGAAYAFLMIITMAHILKVMLRNNSKNSKEDYLMAITSIAYIIFTSLMPAYNPLTSIIFLLYVLVFPTLLKQKHILK